MSPEIATIIAASCALMGALTGAWLKAKSNQATVKTASESSMIASLSTRLSAIEKRLGEMETKYSRLWAYVRQVIDFYYKHKRDDAPDTPPIPDDLT